MLRNSSAFGATKSKLMFVMSRFRAVPEDVAQDWESLHRKRRAFDLHVHIYDCSVRANVAQIPDASASFRENFAPKFSFIPQIVRIVSSDRDTWRDVLWEDARMQRYAMHRIKTERHSRKVQDAFFFTKVERWFMRGYARGSKWKKVRKLQETFALFMNLIR